MFKQAVIQAGGEGTRLRPVTYEIPKPLVPVQGRAILTWLSEWLASAGVEKITVIAPKKWEHVFERWALDWNTSNPWATGSKHKTSTCHVEIWTEPEPLGTMGALVYFLQERFQEPIFLTNGDELKSLNLEELKKHFQDCQSQSSNHAASIALIEVPNPQEYGVAEMQDHRIVRFHEKPQQPPSNRVSSGLYALDPKIFCEVQFENRFLMLERNLFPQLAEQGRLSGCVLSGQWYDCGTLERWEKAIKEWKG